MIIINNELFDAIPTKQFIFKENSWREVLVDLEKEEKTPKVIITNNDNNHQFNPNLNKTNKTPNLIYSYSPPNTESVIKILQPDKTFGENGIVPKEGDMYEFSIDQVRLMYSICYLMASTKKSQALICDYGEDRAFSNSFRAIKSQKVLIGDEILRNTGECDLTTYVNFKALKRVVYTYLNNLKVGGMMSQGDFLEIMQMYERMIKLKEKTTNMKEKQMIESTFSRLVDKEYMGDTYKFLYIHKHNMKPTYPFTNEVFDWIESVYADENKN